MWLYDLALRGVMLAQDATPAAPAGVAEETFNGATSGLSTPQSVMLFFYAIVCVALVCCVTAQTSKSEGLMQQMMGGGTSPYKGKKSVDDTLASATNWAAFFFIGLSILMCLVFH
jgi:protein translocase SecG subunit